MFKKNVYTLLFVALITSAHIVPIKMQAAVPYTASSEEFDTLTELTIDPHETQPTKPKWYSLTQYRAVKKSGVTLLMMYVYMKGKVTYYWQALKVWLATHMPAKYETVQ